MNLIIKLVNFHCSFQHATEETKSSLTNYAVPPTPKPFYGIFSPAINNRTKIPSPLSVNRVGSGNREFDLRNIKSSHSLSENREYYIAFPPSGLPIHCKIFFTYFLYSLTL